MEKKKRIKQREFDKGFYIHLECCMCQDEQIMAGNSKKELSQLISASGWKELDSDYFGVTGYWCGCDYMD